jgi:hypothetical protein
MLPLSSDAEVRNGGATPPLPHAIITPWPLVHKRTIPTQRPPLVDDI